MTPRTVLILCERAPVKVNPVPAVKYAQFGGIKWALGVPETWWECSYCGRRVQVVA
jgi:hypothetical protein